jgi:thioredoxin reductase (NADPH)
MDPGLSQQIPEQTNVYNVPGMFIFLHGAAPTTGSLQCALPTAESGCLIVNRDFATTVPGVCAIGDVICDHLKQAVVVAAERCIAALAAEKLLRERQRVAVDYRKSPVAREGTRS